MSTARTGSAGRSTIAPWVFGYEVERIGETMRSIRCEAVARAARERSGQERE